MILRFIKFFFLSVFILLLFVTRPIFALPQPQGYVNDFAEVLSADFEESLEKKLSDFSTEVGPEISVVTIKSLEGDTIENYAVELFNSWRIGKQDQDNGILFLAAIEDRKMRIEVGYGVEALLNDAEAGRIIRNAIAPEFKKQDYQSGIEKGIQLIIASLNQDPSQNDKPVTSAESGDSFSLTRFFIIAAILVYLSSFLARSKSWWAGGVIGFLLGIFISFTVALLMLFIGLLLDYILSKNYKKLKSADKPTGFWPSKGGFWTGGSTGGGGGGFGGFSGGSSGGGGASGSW